MQRLCLRHNHSVLEEAYQLISSSTVLREVLLGDWLPGTTMTSTLVLTETKMSSLGLQLLAFLSNIHTFDKPGRTTFHAASVNLPNARHEQQSSGSQDQVTPGLSLIFSDRSSWSSVDDRAMERSDHNPSAGWCDAYKTLSVYFGVFLVVLMCRVLCKSM